MSKVSTLYKGHLVVNGKNLVAIPEIRKYLGMTQRDLAGLLDVTIDTIKAWENGRKNPSGTSKRLLQMLAVDPETTLELIKKIQ